MKQKIIEKDIFLFKILRYMLKLKKVKSNIIRLLTPLIYE